MLGFQTFRSVRITLQGIELIHRIKKAQLHYGMDETKYPHFCKALIYAVSTNMEFIVQQKLVGEVLNTSQREKLENAA